VREKLILRLDTPSNMTLEARIMAKYKKMRGGVVKKGG
jgi:hypothetical protein